MSDAQHLMQNVTTLCLLVLSAQRHHIRQTYTVTMGTLISNH